MYMSGSAISPGFFPTNPKWGGTATLSGILPGGGLRYFRPNYAMARGMYGLGQLEVDPTILLVGVGALALGMFLFGTKHGPKLRARKAARLRKRHAALGARLRELEA
jgi:hypothetical protein